MSHKGFPKVYQLLQICISKKEIKGGWDPLPQTILGKGFESMNTNQNCMFDKIYILK